MKFEFVEFNPRRAMRGADAARVRVVHEDGTDDWLWMSRRDISKNMMAFGRCAELTRAYEAYTQGPAAASATQQGTQQ